VADEVRAANGITKKEARATAPLFLLIFEK
jgi:hypothetical protein